MTRWWLPAFLCFVTVFALPFPTDEIESDNSRRVLGSSVVTSVSVIMDLGNGTKKYFADAAGKPLPKPTAAALVGSPAQLLNPDRYEFYTFDESGDLVKRLMTLDEIQGIIANGEGEFPDELPLQTKPNYYHQKLPGSDEVASIIMSDKTEGQAMDMEEISSSAPGVKDVVLSVQNVLKEELQKNKLKPPKPVVAPLPPSTISSPDSSWSMIISAPVDQSMQSSSVPNTAATTTMQPQKFTPTTDKQTSTNTGNANTTKAQTRKPIVPANESYQGNRITTPQPYKPSASHFITTTGLPQKSSTSAELTPAASIIRNTTVHHNAISTESPSASSLRITTASTEKPIITSTETSQVVTKHRTTTAQPPESVTADTSLAVSTTKSTNTEPQTPGASFTGSLASSSNDKSTTAFAQKHVSSSNDTSHIDITTISPLNLSTASAESNTAASNIRITPVQPEQSTTSIESFSVPNNSIVPTTRPQKPSVASTESLAPPSNNSITNIQISNATSVKLSTVASNIKVTTAQPEKTIATSAKLTSVSNNVRTTTPQTQTSSPASSEPIPAANNVTATSFQTEKPNVTIYESSQDGNYVKIATVEPKKPSVTSAEIAPVISSERNVTAHPQISNVSNTESFSAPISIRITTMQPQLHNGTAAEEVSTTINFGNMTTQSQKPNTTSAGSSPASSNIVTSSAQPVKDGASSYELLPVVNNARTTTVPPEKPSDASSLSSSAYNTTKTTTLKPHKYNVSSTQSTPAEVNLKTVTEQPQLFSTTTLPVANTQSAPVSNKISNTTLKPQKLSTASTSTSSTVPASSPAVSEGKIKTQPNKSNPKPSAASHGQTVSMTAAAKNISSTTTSKPLDSTNAITSHKEIQENTTEVSTVLKGGVSAFTSQPSLSAVSSLAPDGNITSTVVSSQVDEIPTSDVISQLYDDNKDVAAAQEFIKLFTPSHSSSSGLNAEQNKVGSVILNVSSQTTSINTLHQSNITAAPSTVTDVPQYYSSVTRTSLPSTKTPGLSINSNKTNVNEEPASSSIKFTELSIETSSKAPLEKINGTASQSMPAKPTILPHLNSSYDVTEDANMLKIEMVKIPDTSATSSVLEANFSSNISELFPAKTEKPLTTEVSSNGEDVMAELADSLSLVLSQVGGSATTIDYGEELHLLGSSSVVGSSTAQSSVTITMEAESSTAVSHTSESNMDIPQGNYVNIMNIKEIMSTEANKQQNTQESTENTSNKTNVIFAESATNEIKVESTSYNQTLKLDSFKTKENTVSEKNDHTVAEIKKPTNGSYETNTPSFGLFEEQKEKEENSLTTGSTDAPNGKESNNFFVTTTDNLEFYTETTTEGVDEVITDKIITGSLKNNEDQYSNKYKKTDFEPLGENSDTFIADFSESSTPTVMHQSTTLDFTMTDSTYSADFHTTISPIESSETELHFMENTKNGPVTDNLNQSSTQTITRETTAVKTTESNTLQIQTESTIPVTYATEEQSTENTKFAPSPSVAGVNESVTVDSGNLDGAKTPSKTPEHQPLTKVTSQDVSNISTNNTHKFDNKIKLPPTLQQKPDHRQPIVKPSPSEDILKLGAAVTHKVENNVQLQEAPQVKPEHRPLIREPLPSEDILKLSTTDANKFEGNIQLQPAPQESLGLEITSSKLGEDVRRFSDLCNELAFRIWVSTSGKGLTATRSLILSPFAVTSLLAMVFLGARGPTSGQMNDILRLDDMVTFNPHLVFRNVTESITSSTNSGVATAAFVRELYSDKTRGKVLDFYKERAQQFYDGHVEEVNFASIGDLVRRRTNLLMKRQTHGRIAEYLHGNNIMLRPPLAAFSANVLQTDCSEASTEGRDGEMYFTVTPAMRQRRLVPVPAAVWRSGFLAGYEPGLDATAVSLGNDKSQVSVILVLPGQQGQLAPGDGLARLEARLIETSLRSQGTWSRLLRTLVARPGLELQLPRFSHRSLLNLTSSLQRMGLRDLFSAERADLRGINGLANDLHLSDIVQVNVFSTCAEEGHTGSRHHMEVFPSSSQRSGRQEVHARKLDADDLSSLPLALRPRQARLPDSKPRLRFDRPFLYFVRHNPTGLILHMGRFNPRIRH